MTHDLLKSELRLGTAARDNKGGVRPAEALVRDSLGPTIERAARRAVGGRPRDLSISARHAEKSTADSFHTTLTSTPPRPPPHTPSAPASARALISAFVLLGYNAVVITLYAERIILFDVTPVMLIYYDYLIRLSTL
ncbi:hypothetical protein EVAR_7645_1 [Eumeta japonica]|uniref:Uncharacterized protein n=1 Tax=Eumeta variegata TaxID=151549 RepID=A0A4C1TI45_EUMVA|nr:hypothetical protein EVAR_7645_1 [Eumeta japonica]